MKHPLFLFFTSLVPCLLLVAVIGCSSKSHETNAREWAQTLGIEKPAIDCDPSFVECGCTVRYVDQTKLEHLVRVDCCGSGCTLRPTEVNR